MIKNLHCSVWHQKGSTEATQRENKLHFFFFSTFTHSGRVKRGGKNREREKSS